MMFFNGFLGAIFLALRRKFAGEWVAFALCLLIWAMIAALSEWDALKSYRWPMAYVIAALILTCAGWAFRRLRALDKPMPKMSRSETLAEFLQARASRIFWFFVSLLIVTVAGYIWRDAHSLVGRLSALPLITLFILHWAVNERRIDLDELPVAALLGPVTAMGFLIVFTFSLGLIRSDTGAPYPLYWPIGLAMLLAEWELTRRSVLVLSGLTYRA
jgi:hypothetical protein